MGSISPAFILQAAQMGMSMIQNAQATKAQNKAIAAQTQARSQQMRRAQEIEDQRRKQRLRQVQATQRARFGAMGVGPRSPSADAVIGGLERRSNSEAAQDRGLLNLQINELNSDAYHRQRANLLEASHKRNQWLMGQLSRFASGGSLLER